jgi:hypothetical protein
MFLATPLEYVSDDVMHGNSGKVEEGCPVSPYHPLTHSQDGAPLRLTVFDMLGCRSGNPPHLGRVV